MPVEFADYLMTTENLLIVVAVWVIMSTLKHVFPQIGENHLWARLAPVLPIALCSIAVWIPGAVDANPITKILLGIVLGAMAANAHKILRQTALGDDERIRQHRRGV